MQRRFAIDDSLFREPAAVSTAIAEFTEAGQAAADVPARRRGHGVDDRPLGDLGPDQRFGFAPGKPPVSAP
jgi:hypothetical protein